MALDDMTTPNEEKNKKRGMVISVLIHIILVLLALLPLLTYPDPPPGQEGILVNLGLPDEGQGFENAGPAEPVPEAEPIPEEEPIEEEIDPEPVETEPAPTPDREVIKTEDPEEIALRKKREEEARERREEELRKQREEAERRRQEEAERKRREEEARRKAEADKLKNEIGGLFGEGKGKGETGKEGNQGDPEGDPNASELEGKSFGDGRVGGGLGSRGVLALPKPEDNSQNTGTVVIEVCVNAAGNVISAEFTQRGSTTANPALVRSAVSAAKKSKFAKGDVDTQCGTITYNFRVQ